MKVRRVLGLAVGLLIGSAVFMTVAMIATLFPPTSPANVEYWSFGERAGYFGSMPLGAYLTTAFGCLLAGLAGGWFAAVVSKERNWMFLSVLLGVLLTFIGIINMFVVEAGQPMWSANLALIMFIPFSIIGYRLRGFSFI